MPIYKNRNSNTDRLQSHDDRHSSQLDIIVYDFDAYPVFERFEEFCIVPPEGVVGIVSVKKTLTKTAIKPELQALKKAADLCQQSKRRGPFTALFAFSTALEDQSLEQAIFKNIVDVHSGHRFDPMVNEVSILGRMVAFKIRSNHSTPNFARYVSVNCESQQHIPLQRLLNSLMSVYYDQTRGSNKERPGFVSFEKGTFSLSPTMGEVPYSSL